MKWDQGHESPDVIDRRGAGGGRGLVGMLGFLPMLLRMRGGWVIALIVVGVMVAAGSGGLGGILGGGSGEATTTGAPVAGQRTADKKAQFVAFVLDDTQATWRRVFTERGKTYRNAKLVMFTGATQTSCGQGQAAAGPFYCPTDEKVYLDLAFFDELRSRFGAKGGPFAEGYVVAHEYGHHVQNLLGLLKTSGTQSGAQSVSVRTELQADCLAGVWASHAAATGFLVTPTDAEIAQALDAAAAVGDDRIQKQTQGRVSPESWTHGSSAQRTKWFTIGLDSGDLNTCDTSGGL